MDATSQHVDTCYTCGCSACSYGKNETRQNVLRPGKARCTRPEIGDPIKHLLTVSRSARLLSTSTCGKSAIGFRKQQHPSESRLRPCLRHCHFWAAAPLACASTFTFAWTAKVHLKSWFSLYTRTTGTIHNRVNPKSWTHAEKSIMSANGEIVPRMQLGAVPPFRPIAILAVLLESSACSRRTAKRSGNKFTNSTSCTSPSSPLLCHYIHQPKLFNTPFSSRLLAASRHGTGLRLQELGLTRG